jgi:predicted ABC-type transport system involved in lysophospholipase L1 biosynthesis ATPase subunit
MSEGAMSAEKVTGANSPAVQAVAPLVEMRDIRIAFGGVHAVEGVTVDLRAGEVVGLVGGNGAGKSTLMRALSGAHAPDSGEILVDGQVVPITNPRDAKALGIETIYQTLALADNIDAAGNMFLGRELRTRTGSLDDDAMESATRKVIGRLNPRFKAFKRPVMSLSGGQRQSVAIARAVHRGDGPGSHADQAAQGRRDRNLPDQPRHPRRVRPVGPHQRDAPREAGRDRPQGRRHDRRGPGHDHHGQAPERGLGEGPGRSPPMTPRRRPGPARQSGREPAR